MAAGPHRVDPPCPYVGDCGGCSWQQIAYDEQLRQKRMLVEDSLRRGSGFIDARVNCIHGSPREFRYRNRAQLHRGQTGEIGFRARRSSRVVDVADCLIVDEALSAEISAIRTEVRNSKRPLPPERFEIYLTDDGRAARATASPDDEAELALGPAFGQVNSQQNEALVAHVVASFIRLSKGRAPLDSIWDIYAGSGNFTFPLALAHSTATIVGVEAHSGAVAAGNARACDLGLDGRVSLIASTAEKWLDDIQPSGRVAALIDPPRIGCNPQFTRALAATPLEFLIYVSCHPATLARDLRAFSEAGWSLDEAVAFDMFPQTDHVETVVCLRPPTSFAGPLNV